MFGHESKPSKIYSYGANPPTENLGMAEAQFRLAHRYRNELVALERGRRDRVDALLAKLAPGLQSLEADIAAAETQLEDARARKKAKHAAGRKRTSDPGEKTVISDLSARLKTLRAERKAIRERLFASAEWQEAQKEIEGSAEEGAKRADGKARKKKKRVDGWFGREKKRIYAEFRDAGLGWGTCVSIEQAAKAFRKDAPPQFRRWDGKGKLAVQLQGGLSVEEALACRDTQVQVEAKPGGVWVQGKRRPRKLGTAILRLRVASEGRNPVWCVVPFHLHRPLPEGAQIKWVYLLRRRIGTHDEWRVQFVLSQDSWARPDAAPGGSVGIDVGWRLMQPDGRLRVAVWSGDDGADGELSLPPWWLEQMRKTEDIRSIRDGLLNDASERLTGWLGGLAEVPGWIRDFVRGRDEESPSGREAVRRISCWRAHGRFAALAIRWRDNRFDGDDAALEALESWRKRDRHLHEYEANLRDQLQGHRENMYRVFAADMRRRYAMACVEDMDLRKFHVLPKAEEEAKDGAFKEHVRDACLSSLFKCLKESVTTVLPVPAPSTTSACHACGSEQSWDRAILSHTCSSCGSRWDQDVNAARNLLRRGAASEPVASGSR